VNHSVDEIRNICESTQIDVVQLSGDETLEMIQKIGEMAYKALRVSRLEEAKALIENLPKRSAPPAFLIDSYEKGAYGGTGKIGSWELAAQIAEEYSILLAGGLKPENIAEAVGKVRPWGVDVASGVEQENGVKTPERIIEFIQKAKAAAEQISI
jgi:phosphoribosylanthranilate isomerase